jgi:hypothetical protein
MESYFRCARCQIFKPKDEFHRSRKDRRGIVSRCKVCISETRRERCDAMFLEQERARTRRYTERNRERINARNRQRRLEQPEKRREECKRWKDKHPLCRKQDVVNGRAKKYGHTQVVSVSEIEALWEAQGGVCPITLMPLTPSSAPLHHVVHLANGGSNTIGNLIFTTRQVANRKRKMSLEEFCAKAGLDYFATVARIEKCHRALLSAH